MLSMRMLFQKEFLLVKYLTKYFLLKDKVWIKRLSISKVVQFRYDKLEIWLPLSANLLALLVWEVV